MAPAPTSRILGEFLADTLIPLAAAALIHARFGAQISAKLAPVVRSLSASVSTLHAAGAPETA